MRITKIIKEEVEREIDDKVLCDNCEKEIENADSCGLGKAFSISLNDAWCYDCGGKTWDFCSFKCLKNFVNKNKLEEPKRLSADTSSNKKEIEDKNNE